MCFLLRGHRFKTRGEKSMYAFVDLAVKIVAQRWVPCPTNKGVSYTNLVFGLAVTSKFDNNCNNEFLQIVISQHYLHHILPSKIIQATLKGILEFQSIEQHPIGSEE